MIIIPRQKEILDDFYKKSFIKKPTLEKELQFWSFFVNKKYLSVIPTDIYIFGKRILNHSEKK